MPTKRNISGGLENSWRSDRLELFWAQEWLKDRVTRMTYCIDLYCLPFYLTSIYLDYCFIWQISNILPAIESHRIFDVFSVFWYVSWLLRVYLMADGIHSESFLTSIIAFLHILWISGLTFYCDSGPEDKSSLLIWCLFGSDQKALLNEKPSNQRKAIWPVLCHFAKKPS